MTEELRREAARDRLGGLKESFRRASDRYPDLDHILVSSPDSECPGLWIEPRPHVGSSRRPKARELVEFVVEGTRIHRFYGDEDGVILFERLAGEAARCLGSLGPNSRRFLPDEHLDMHGQPTYLNWIVAVHKLAWSQPDGSSFQWWNSRWCNTRSFISEPTSNVFAASAVAVKLLLSMDALPTAVPDATGPTLSPANPIDYLGLIRRLREKGRAKPAALIELMMNRFSAPAEEVAKSVHGDGETSNNTISKMVSRTNAYLIDLESPVSLSFAGGHIHKHISPE